MGECTATFDVRISAVFFQIDDYERLQDDEMTDSPFGLYSIKFLQLNKLSKFKNATLYRFYVVVQYTVFTHIEGHVLISEGVLSVRIQGHVLICERKNIF